MEEWKKIFIALFSGMVFGLIIGPKAAFLLPVGKFFLQSISMLIIPLIFCSMVSGISAIPNTQDLRKMGTIASLLYAVSTLLAIILAVLVSSIAPIGSLLSDAMQLFPYTTFSSPISSSWHETILSLIPKNPIKSFSDQNVIQTIVFALFFGIALRSTQSKGAAVRELIEAISIVIHQMVRIIMKMAPIGVFVLMGSSIGNIGVQLLFPISLFLLSYYFACLLHVVVLSLLFLRGVSGLLLAPFFKNIKEVFLVAISTCSSSASLPIAMKSAVEKFGVEKRISDFILPLSCSINMNGSALFQVMASFFIADAYGIILSTQQYITLAVTVGLTSIGTASVPGAGFMTLSIVFLSTGIPTEGLILLAGIDRLRDMATTSVNVISDVLCTIVVAKKSDNFNTEIFYSEKPDRAFVADSIKNKV